MKKLLLAGTLFTALMFMVGFTLWQQKQAASRAQWDYKVIPFSSTVSASAVEGMLQQEGADGWELVTVEHDAYIFKRAK